MFRSNRWSVVLRARRCLQRSWGRLSAVSDHPAQISRPGASEGPDVTPGRARGDHTYANNVTTREGDATGKGRGAFEVPIGIVTLGHGMFPVVRGDVAGDVDPEDGLRPRQTAWH